MSSTDDSGVLRGVLCCKLDADADLDEDAGPDGDTGPAESGAAVNSVSAGAGGGGGGGGREESARAPGNLVGAAIVVVNGTDPVLGPFTAVQRTWTAGNCTSITTSIRQYRGAAGGIEFVTEVGAAGAGGTATEPKLAVAGTRLATEFPSFALPRPAAAAAASASSPGLLTWDGNSLRGMTRGTPQPADLAALWSGGLEGGPLVLHSTDPTSNATATCVIGPSNQFKAAIMSRAAGAGGAGAGSRLVAGVHGMVASLPPRYTVRFGLVGSAQGVTAAVMGCGHQPPPFN
jgi:hypothetical protein